MASRRAGHPCRRRHQHWDRSYNAFGGRAARRSDARTARRPRKEPACRVAEASRGPGRRGTVPSTPHDAATATSAKTRSMRLTTRAPPLWAATSATEARSSRDAIQEPAGAISVRSRSPSSAPVRWHSCRMSSLAAGMTEVAADVHADVTWSESSRSALRSRLRERAWVAPRRDGSARSSKSLHLGGFLLGAMTWKPPSPLRLRSPPPKKSLLI